MIRKLGGMTFGLLLVLSCQSGPESVSFRKGGISNGSLAKKKFSDDAFQCASLTSNEEAASDEGGDEEGGSPLETQAEGDSSRGGEGEDPMIIDSSSRRGGIFKLVADSVTYDGKIKALLAAKCVGCHKPGGTSPDVSTYETAKAAGEDSLRTIEDGSMPTAGPLPDADQQAFKAWVTGGYLKSSPGGTSGGSGGGTASGSKNGPAKGTRSESGDEDSCGLPVATKEGGGGKSSGSSSKNTEGSGSAPQPTYLGGIKALLDSKCNACHKAGGTPPDLTSYAKAKEGGPASLAAILDDSMPTSKPLPADQKELFQKWADADYPEK